MFNLEKFDALYNLLSTDMVVGDCGIKCNKYCCQTDNTIKYFLPYEDEYFLNKRLENFEIVNYYLFTSYRSKNQSGCLCTRDLRPFCCRIFPFRPIIDQTFFQVTGLKKATGYGFDQYCWINEPLADWQTAAIKAWQMVLNDPDNLKFYAQQAVFLTKAKENFAVSTTSLLYQIREELVEMSVRELWKYTALFFDQLGKPN
ncbi:MAG: hypothetical protein JNM06_03180 [Blastocatellia bacterium]|nr:hypothetical protein [Blastocatellia bacterium]MBN8725576.1 hypothetical protein [Acidobacteriota bacterium]